MVGVVGSLCAQFLGTNHLRVTGNRGQSILEFVGDAGGKLAKSREIFLELHLLLQGGELGQVAQQANRPVDLFVAFANRGDSDSQVAALAGRGRVLDLLAAEDSTFREAVLYQSRELGPFA